MSITITLKLQQDARVFPAGESTGFGIRGGVRYYDRETRNQEFTNYECAIFAQAPAQVKFYKDVLVKDSIVEVTAPTAKIKQFQGKDKLLLSIQLIDATMGYVGYGASGSRRPAASTASTAAEVPPGASSEQAADEDGFIDEDIPF